MPEKPVNANVCGAPARLVFRGRKPGLAEQALTILRRLREHGFETYFAGGCVRDALRGAEVKDIDVATAATPDEVAALFPAQSVGVGQAFGVMLVQAGGHSFDVATFRKDGGYQDGRHPETVAFEGAEQDALRRDFTVNALFYDPLAERVIDFVGGLSDLRAGVLRTVGDPVARFREDRLRMLRAVRFSAVCGWQIDPGTWAALKAEAPSLMCVSMERIRTEFLRMLGEAPVPSQALEMLQESGLLAMFFPELTALRGCLQTPKWHPEGDVWVHTARMLDLAPAPRSPQLVWAVLLHDIGKPRALVVETQSDGALAYRTPCHAAIGAEMVPEILRRFKESRELMTCVREAVANHMKFMELPKMRPATARQFLGRSTIPLELELHRLDCLSSHAKLELYELAKAKLAVYAKEPILPSPSISGRELLACGYVPGPALGERLKMLYSMQLEGASRAELLEQALLEAPVDAEKPRSVLFVVAPGHPFPLRSAWEALCARPGWTVQLLVLPGVSWQEPPHPQRKIWRMVADCAGCTEYPDVSGFQLIVAPKGGWPEDERPHEAMVWFVETAVPKCTCPELDTLSERVEDETGAGAPRGCSGVVEKVGEMPGMEGFRADDSMAGMRP